MITINIQDKPLVEIEYLHPMNAQQALEMAYDIIDDATQFSYSLEYYGANLGYLVDMINDTYDTYESGEHPYFFWELLVNNKEAMVGIDNLDLHDNDVINMRYIEFDPKKDSDWMQSQTKIDKLHS